MEEAEDRLKAMGRPMEMRQACEEGFQETVKH